MVSTLSKLFIVGIVLGVFFFLNSAGANAYIYGSAYDSYYSPYWGKGNYFAFPRSSGSFQSAYQRNSFDLDQFITQDRSTARTHAFTELFNDRVFGASFGYDRNMLDLNEFARTSQGGNSYDTGSISYVEGDGNLVTYERILEGGIGRSKSGRFKIHEVIKGGPQIRATRNFGTTNNYATTTGYDARGLTDSFTSGTSFADKQVSRNTVTQEQMYDSLSNRYSLQETSFGNGFTLVFN